MPTNALAKKPSNKLLDYIIQNIPADALPTAGKTYVESMQGKKGDITESNFSKEELDSLRRLIASTGDKGDVQYKDYAKLMLAEKGGAPVSLTPSLYSMASPLGNIQTTLGRFKYARDPDGTLRVIDMYDFNPLNASNSDAALTEANTGALGPYNMLRMYAGEKLPPGAGRRVNINLGK